MAITSIPIDTVLRRALAVIVCVVFSGILLVFAKWCFGNAIATQAGDTELAEFAVRLAPDDPQARFTLAVLTEKTFLSEDLERSLKEYQRGVSLAPNDYRLWLALAKAFERQGDFAGAESAFKRSRELAPNYALVRWTYGNFLLRQGNRQVAFDEIRSAAESNNTYLRPAVSAAWQSFEGNLAEIRKIFGASSDINSMLSTVLAEEKRFDESFELWQSLPEDKKRTRYKEDGRTLYGHFLAANRFRGAQEIHNQITDGNQIFRPEKLSNGGFEADVKPAAAEIFDWRLGEGLQPQILLDETHKVEGRRSVVFLFNSADGADFRALSQKVVTEPNKKYTLSFSYRSELKANSNFNWVILDPSGNHLAKTESFHAAKDWIRVRLDFITGENDEAVEIGIGRLACVNGICPLSGKIWFDDFRLEF